MKKLKNSIYIDALALVPEKKSGIGYSLEQTFLNLADINQGQNPYTIYLVVPLGKAGKLKQYLRQNVKTKTIFLPAAVLEFLLRMKLFPPMDWLLGTGTYIFPNYRNWPLWRSRSITYVYDLSFIKFPELVQAKNQKYLSRYINKWASRADRIVTITTQVRCEIEKELNQPYEKIAVVYCGVDPKTFYRRDAAEIAKVKAKYALNLKKYILFVGNIEPRKNLVGLLEAYDSLPQRLQDEYGLLIIGGDGWLNEEFNLRLASMLQNGKNIVRPNDYIKTEDLPALYSGAKTLVLPAIYEGFGITPLEAMACETPIVVSDIPAIREVAEGSAFYCDPLSSDSIRDALVCSLTDSEAVKSHVNYGKKRAHSLTWEDSAKALRALIEGEFSKGPHKRPVVKRLKLIYVNTDVRLRSILGDKAFKAYRPKSAPTLDQFRANVYQDFLAEQPSYLQTVTLRIYLATKHLSAKSIKTVYAAIRNKR